MTQENRVFSMDEYVNRLIVAIRRVRDTNHSSEKAVYNNTEMRLIGEIVAANMEGEHVISTELASLLGVTRSAVSQMVNRMEAKGIVKRVAAPNDRKKMFVELTDSTREIYESEKSRLTSRLDRVAAKMGTADMQKLLELSEKFIQCQEEVAREDAKK